MAKRWSIHPRGVTKPRAILGMVSILIMALLVAAACGEDATATPVPATATPEPAAVLRPISEWTADNPATLAEIEAELENYKGESLVFVSWGGAYQGAQRKAYLEPFQEKFGIEIVEESPVEYAKIRSMAETGNVTWHVVDISGLGGIQQGLSGALEELDFGIIDHRDFPEIIRDAPWMGGGGMTFSNVIAYSTKTYPEDGSQPTTMADFFDVEKFPGRRGMSRPEWGWKPNLHFALLSANPELLETAEGRATLTRLSDEQIDEAFEIMRDFKPHVTIWWTQGSDCPVLLVSGELDMCTAWNGRIFDAQKEGAPVKVCWTCGHVLNTEAFVVPKGLKEQDSRQFELAQLFLAWTAFPEINAQLSKYISYGPINLGAIPILEGPEFAEVREHLPSSSDNIQYAILSDEAWSGEVGGKMAELWLAFMQE